MKIYYEDIFISDFHSNRSMTIENMLKQIEFDEQAFKKEYGFDEIDYNQFKIK